MAEAGWYPDPQDAQSLQYFDGQNWTGQRRPLPAAGESGGVAAQATTQNPRWDETRPRWSGQPQQPQAQPPQQQPQNWGGAAAAPQQQYGQQPQQYGQQPPQQYGQPQSPWTPTPAKKSKKAPLIITAVVVVAALAGVLAFVLLRGGGDDPKITYQGKALANGPEALTKAEASLSGVVAKRHGVKGADTRCYYVIPDTPESGAKKTDIEQTMRCGPVLFVDGNKDNEYVAVGVSGTVSGSKATLTAQDVASDVTPAKLDQSITLIRPDGKKQPAGDGGLTVPVPPAADKDLLTVARLDSSAAPKPVSGAVIVGYTTRVTVTAAGYISRYGTGDAARSAPAGQRLLAFRLTYGEGEQQNTGATKATVVVGGTTRTLPTAPATDQWIVYAVPTSSTPYLQMRDGGINQTLSLPDGKPGATNAQVTLRQHDFTSLSSRFVVPLKVTSGGNSATIKLSVTATSAALSYWSAIREAIHASAANKAILRVQMTYTDPTSPGRTFGFDAEQLHIRLPDGQLIAARDIATDPKKVYTIFDVPADFTSGKVEISGTIASGSTKITFSANPGVNISIPAG